MNKKGGAEALVTLTLVTIAIATVSLMGYMVLGIIETEAKKIQTSPESCLALQLETNPVLEITNACYNSQTRDIHVTVKSSSYREGYIDSVSFLLDDSVWQCSSSCSDCKVPETGSTKTYYFTADNPSEVKKVKVYLGDCEIDARNVVGC